MIDLLKPKKTIDDIDTRGIKKRYLIKAKWVSCLFCKERTINKIELSTGKVACCDKCKHDFDSVRLKIKGEV